MVMCGEDFRFFLGLFSGRTSGGRVERDGCQGGEAECESPNASGRKWGNWRKAKGVPVGG